MTTLVVLSDSHGRGKVAQKLAPLFAENDYIVHLGDGSVDLRDVARQYPTKTYICKGNCDMFYGEDEYVIQVEKLRIFCCHGHRYGVKTALYKLAARAQELNCSVALYGHTHTAGKTVVDGVTCINPGSAGSFVDASYCYLVIMGDRLVENFVAIQ